MIAGSGKWVVVSWSAVMMSIRVSPSSCSLSRRPSSTVQQTGESQSESMDHIESVLFLSSSSAARTIRACATTRSPAGVSARAVSLDTGVP
jgi:hypothetical protein